MSDGDNCQWLTSGFTSDPKWYGSPYRGNFDMTWDLSPTLAEMNPVAFDYIYQHASNGAHKDNFVTPSGAGITFPSQYSDISGLVHSISQSMQAADQKVISVLDPSYDPAKLHAILNDPQVLGMMFKTYANYYEGRNGALEFYNGKPILSVKYSLWDGTDTARSIADALNASPHRDALNDPASFSVVNVHPWSTQGPNGSGTGDPMSNLNQLVQWLDPTKVEVVTLEELMVHLRNNFGTPVAWTGDYNADGIVDAADYVVWRNNEGTNNTLPNDLIGGMIGQAQYDQWREQFGATSGSGSLSRATVPEPVTIALVTLSAAGWSLQQGRGAYHSTVH